MRGVRVVATGALIAAVALTSSCGVIPRRQAPQAAPIRGSVPRGVRVAGRMIGGMSAAEAELLIAGLSPELHKVARNAYVDPNTRGLVPGVAGLALDATATLRGALAAAPGQDVSPVLVPVTPSITMRDLPAAPIYNGSPQRQAVAFVINVAWGDQYVPGMLKTLAVEKVPVTWCLVGRWAEQHPDLVREMVRTGQAAGTPYTFCNHGYRDHGWALLNQEQAMDSITSADHVIAGLTGAPPRYFSPHRGEYNGAVLAASREAGHELVLWSLDTIDWKNPSADWVRTRIVSRAKAGDIVLMHPTAPTEQALAAMIQGVRAKGLALVTLDTLLSPERGAWDG